MTKRVSGAYAVAVQSEMVDVHLLREARAEGLAVFAWTVNDAHVMRRIVSMGVDGVVTDEPALLTHVMREMRTTCQKAEVLTKQSRKALRDQRV